MRSPRLRDADGVEYDPETGERRGGDLAHVVVPAYGAGDPYIADEAKAAEIEAVRRVVIERPLPLKSIPPFSEHAAIAWEHMRAALAELENDDA